MKISVAICTWNRAALLAQTLAYLERLEIPAGQQWEVLVVNNRCTDDTDAVLRKFQRSLPLRRLYEERAGLSNARNCAVQHAQGDLMLWTDDDVRVGSQWLQSFGQASERHPQAAFFGGPILPWFEGTPPRWLNDVVVHYGSAFALRDLGDSAAIVSEYRLPFGANFAIRTAVQRRFPYDAQLGRKGFAMLGNDEISVLKAVLDSGGTGYWVPSAQVRHFIPRSRQTVGYLFRFFAGQGQVESLLGGRPEVPLLLGRPRWLWRRLLEASARYYAARFLSPPQVWSARLEEFARTVGALRVRADVASTAGSSS
ncbi:MAG: glycosyltransferase [Planctomycetales bacterium]|nr:glycosyltransferase [Planctomycetales bacterium]